MHSQKDIDVLFSLMLCELTEQVQSLLNSAFHLENLFSLSSHVQSSTMSYSIYTSNHSFGLWQPQNYLLRIFLFMNNKYNNNDNCWQLAREFAIFPFICSIVAVSMYSGNFVFSFHIFAGGKHFTFALFTTNFSYNT